MELKSDIQYIPGVGPKRAEMLRAELKVSTVDDLLNYYPYRYVDRSRIYHVSDISSEVPYIQLKGKLRNVRMQGEGRSARLTAMLYDETGQVELVWFKGMRYVQDKINNVDEFIVFGKPSLFNGAFNIAHPEIDVATANNQKKDLGWQSLYNTSERMKHRFLNSAAIRKIMYSVVSQVSDRLTETLPSYIVNKYHLLDRKSAIINIHFPHDGALLQQAQARLKFEELFYIQLSILKQSKYKANKTRGFMFSSIGYYFNTFYKEYLPFELTGAQKRVLKEIRHDVGSGIQMNRLLQGDVGSGKTLVALLSMLMAVDNGYQACLMAPTEILASQHYQTVMDFLGYLNITVELLTGSTKKSDRERIHENLLNGKLNLLIGTHALLEDAVQFKNLGLVVIDEQHRFGVAQRARLWSKNAKPPHILVMTATPIPRTLAMTVYGDLDISVIDELPPGRKDVLTYHYYDNRRDDLLEFLKKQINEGRQAYIVYPLIQESEKSDLKCLEEGYAYITEHLPHFRVSMVHGKLKPQDKEQEMQKFVVGETQIMVATTVIEVGVNVPNASVMVIESAQRFGLSQLHQLRGRVGRGAAQSYCILLTPYKISGDTRKRIETLVRTNDGFEIAEADLQLRGPGDMEGTQQSGLPFELKIANISKDSSLLTLARDAAILILEEDPLLSMAKNQLLVEQLSKKEKEIVDWSRIS